MQAMVLQQPRPAEEGPLQPVDLPAPTPGPGQVRLRVEACGVCHTDLHVVEGDLPPQQPELVPGHQVVGVIDARGRGVSQYDIGERVGVAWLGHTCGRCPACKQQKENLCPQAQFTGYHRHGGFAEYALADADFVYPVPDNVAPVAAAPLLCAGIIGYRALKLSGIKPGQRLGLYGFGASAHIAIQIARHWDCEVYVFSRTEAHLELARDLDAAWAGRIDEPLPTRLNAGVIFAPAGTLVPPALEHLDRGGTLALAGIVMSDIPPLDYVRHLYHEKVLRSVANSTRADGRELMQLAGAIGLKTRTESFALAQANEVLARLKHSEIEAAAVLCPGRP